MALGDYGTRRCAVCERVFDLMRETGRPVHVRDLATEPLTWDELRHLAALAGGIRHILSVQAPAYRALDLARTHRTEPELLGLLAADPSLLRRPIVVEDDLVLVGFDGDRSETP